MGTDPKLKLAPKVAQNGTYSREVESEECVASGDVIRRLLNLERRMDSDNSGQQLSSQIYHYVPGTIVPAILYLVSSAVFTRLFSSDEYGRYMLCLTGMLLLSVVTSQWLQQGILRFLPGAPCSGSGEKIRKAIVSGLLRVTLPGASFLGLLCVVAVARDETWFALVVPAAGLLIVTSIYGPLGIVLQASMLARRFSIYQMVDALARFVVGLLAVLLVYRSPSSLLWASVASVALLIPFAWRSAGLQRFWGARKRELQGPNLVRQMAIYGLPMTAWYFAFTLLGIGDRFLLEYTRGPTEVGIYAANYTLIAGGVSLISAPIVTAMHPFLMALWNNSGDIDEAGRWLGRIIEWFLQIGMLIVMLLYLFARDAAQIFLGNEFRDGAVVMPILMAGFIFWQIGLYTHKPLEFAGKTKKMVTLAVAALVLNVALNLIALPRFGYEAAPYTKVIAYAFYIAGTVFVSRNILMPSLRWGRVIRNGFVIVTLGVLVAITRPLVEAMSGRGIAFVFSATFAAIGSVLIGYSIVHGSLGRLLGRTN